MFNHFITIATLSEKAILKLLHAATQFLPQDNHSIFPHSTSLMGETLGTVFFEPSTRTRLSFTLAAKRLGAFVVNIEKQSSAVEKGESLLDTLLTLEAMGCRLLVVRHPENHVLDDLVDKVQPTTHLINGGDGTHAHPTQSLLDLFTIQQHKKHFQSLTVAVVGDILHSRVARSTIEGLQKLQTKTIRLVGPKVWIPETFQQPPFHVTDNLAAGIENADVIIALRIQKERLGDAKDSLDLDTYIKHFRIDKARLKNAKSDAIIMHPGPVNRDIEVTHEVLESPQCVMREQVRNGVAVRMALLETLALTNPPT